MINLHVDERTREEERLIVQEDSPALLTGSAA
jgi:hypothetical protein